MRSLGFVAVVVGLFALASGAQAASITFVLDQHFGAQPASGSISITFDDEGTPGTVKVTMDTSGLTNPNEFVTKWYFSYNGDATLLSVPSLSIDTSDASWKSYSRATAQTLQADGDGKYNVLWKFQTSAGAGRFTMGEQFSFVMSYPGLVANDFNVIGAVGGGNGPFYSAAHVQGTGTGAQGSDWLGANNGRTPDPIPEPGTIALVALAAAGLLRRKLV